MSRTTVANAKAELYALLWTASTNTPTFSVATVDATQIRVYDHEPRGDHMQSPVSVTISTAAMTPTEWTVVVRVYVTTAHYSAKVAQDNLDLLIPAVDVKIGSTAAFGPSQWDIAWEDSLDAFMASCVLSVGREDDWAM